MTNPDPISEMYYALIRAGADEAICLEVVAEVRSTWGGSQAYIHKNGAEEVSRREQIIKDGILMGHAVEDIAKRASVSKSTIRRRRSTWF